MRGRKVLLVAGEASGDVHGAELVTALRHLDPYIEVYGVGGDKLRAAGMHVLVDTASIATMGLTEVVGAFGRILRMYRKLKRFLVDERPALVVLIDYAEFNMFLAKRVRAMGIPVFYYIAPQVWAWRQGRVRKLAQRVDRLAAIFPFEPQFYNRERPLGEGPHDERPLAEFIGHPLVDVVRATRSREETFAKYGFDVHKPLLALLPGSRRKEIRTLLPPALAAAQKLAAEGWQVVLALAHTLSPQDLAEIAESKPLRVPVIENDTYNLVHAADAALVASGTATLETALLGRPMVIMYRVSALTFAIARRLVRVDHIGMPNIILGRRVFPELLQEEVTCDKLVEAVHDITNRKEEVQQALLHLREALGEPGAAERGARIALELMRSGCNEA